VFDSTEFWASGLDNHYGKEMSESLLSASDIPFGNRSTTTDLTVNVTEALCSFLESRLFLKPNSAHSGPKT
jgi:hypothetical protein